MKHERLTRDIYIVCERTLKPFSGIITKERVLERFTSYSDAHEFIDNRIRTVYIPEKITHIHSLKIVKFREHKNKPLYRYRHEIEPSLNMELTLPFSPLSEYSSIVQNAKK